MSQGLEPDLLDMTLEAFREFAEGELDSDTLLRLDAQEEFPVELIRQLTGDGLGIQLLFIPEEYGGMGGGAFDVYRLCEAMARVDLGIATGVLATFLGSDPIRVGGTAEQRSHWMGRLAEEGLLMAYAATEPDAGSDLANLKTTATPVHENGDLVGYRLDGAKQWISNGGFADLYTVLALAPGGASWFLVEKGAPGLSAGRPEQKHGIRDSNTAAVILEDVEVAPDQLLGGVEGQGLIQAQEVFGYTRLMVAAFGLGAGWEALDRAARYSLDRHQAGGPLAEKQGYTHKLIVPHAVRLEASRALIEETAERIDAEEGTLNTEGAIAKYMASEAGNAAAESAMQALGGYGYTHEYMVEKIKRDVRITTIYEGTSEIMEMTIARDRWQQHLKTRGRYYHDRAEEARELHERQPGVGADVAALALDALAEILERCRVGRLTRNQHVLLRLGSLVADAEGAACLARRAARGAEEGWGPKSETRFSPTELAAFSRVFARHVALRLGTEGAGLVAAAGVDGAGLTAALGLEALVGAQGGLLDDMDRVADAIYGRTD
ncbi:MAG: acyl-CoA dehydrogenase [Gemmatimonadetes bacterium]|nr:acyl-CoA dehydrogenase [Gemmatimonadota bacterium]